MCRSIVDLNQATFNSVLHQPRIWGIYIYIHTYSICKVLLHWMRQQLGSLCPLSCQHPVDEVTCTGQSGASEASSSGIRKEEGYSMIFWKNGIMLLWSGLLCSGLLCSGLVCSGLVWSALVCSGLVWCLVCLSACLSVCLSVSAL